MTEYEDAILSAEKEAGEGRYKEAYNSLGIALNIGGHADRECRYRRGVYALRVGGSRLDTFEKGEGSGQTLIKAGCWLSRSEAYLNSSREGASDEDLQTLEGDLQETKAEQERFRRLCRTSKLSIFEDDEDDEDSEDDDGDDDE